MKNTSLVIGIDPGKTTGWFEVWPDRRVYYAQLKRNEVELALESRLVIGDVLVSSERFVTSVETAKKAPEPDASHIEGVIKNTCEKFEDCHLVFNTPAEKNRVPDKMLKSLGWWVENQRHAMDGARHALVGMANHDVLLFAKIVEGVVA